MAEKKSVKTKKQTAKKTQSKPQKKPDVKKIQNEFDQLKDRHIRLKAEFENFRKRKNKEISSLLQYDGEGIIKEILQIIDDIEDRFTDEEVGRSNYVSLLSQTMNPHEAEAMACEKARYLIRQCETHDRRLPEFASGILTPGIKQLNFKLDRLSKS